MMWMWHIGNLGANYQRIEHEMRDVQLCLLVCASLTVIGVLNLCVLTLVDGVSFQIPKVARSTTSVEFERPQNETRLRRLPSCLIIGVRKGGTRALVDGLSLHPQIRAARREVHFFDRNDSFARGVSWYREQMPFSYANQVTIEKSPGYLTSAHAAQRVYDINPKMKIIIILREPVTRIVSDFTQVVYNRMELNKSLPIFEENVFIQNKTLLNFDYKPVRNSLYDIHIKRWLDYFPLEQILILDGDLFAVKPLTQLRLAEKFIGVAPSIKSEQLVWNSTKGFYCFRRNVEMQPKCLGHSKGRQHWPVNKWSLELVRKQLKPHNKRLFTLINKVFNW